MNIKIRRLLVLPLLAALSACAGSGSPADSFRLVSTVTRMRKDAESGEWTEYRREEYRYENGYPVSCTRYETGLDQPHEYSFSYTFENGLPAEMTMQDFQNGSTSFCEYNEGRVWRTEFTGKDSLYTSTVLYQYGLPGPFFTDVLHASRGESADDTGAGYTMEELDSVSVFTKDGLLEKTVNSGLYANWNDGDEKEWMRFNGTYTAEYENGIAVRTSAEFRAGPSGPEQEFELKRENGLVAEAVIKDMHQDTETEKIIFTYSDAETDAVRYTSMINYFLLEGGSNYYIYNWY